MRSFTLPKVSGSMFRQSAVECRCQISLFITTSILFSGSIRNEPGTGGAGVRVGQGIGNLIRKKHHIKSF